MLNQCSNCGFNFTNSSQYIYIKYQPNIPAHAEILRSVKPSDGTRCHYCSYCAPYFQELEIKRTGAISIAKNLTNVDVNAFNDFINKQKQWTEWQLNEKDRIIAAKDQQITSLKEQVLALQLQAKEKEVETLQARIEQLELTNK